MFTDFAKVVQAQFGRMSQGELYTTDTQNMFGRYLAAFPDGTNPIYKIRTVHECNCCKQFINRLGGLVAIDDGKIVSIWDDAATTLLDEFGVVSRMLRDAVHASQIVTVFRTKERQYGQEYNYGPDKVRHDHFCGRINDRHFALDPETKRGEQEAIFQVCNRGLTEIKLDDIETVLDLIEANQLYRGAENKPAIIGFRELMRGYMAAPHGKNFVWANLGNRNARFRNTAIGSLLSDLAEGMDVDTAVRKFENKVDATNYKRTTAVITQKMVEKAVETLNELNLGAAIYRRFAVLPDVSVVDMKWVDSDTRSKMRDSITEVLMSSVKAPMSVGLAKNSTPISAEEFLKTILPTAKRLGLFLENRHSGNFISLTAPRDSSGAAARLFKWDNAFAWSYDGDVTDSVKQRVKAAGGKIDCLFRISLSWFNKDDLDLHCYTPSGQHIYFGQKAKVLDVDMNAGFNLVRNPVENLAFDHLEDGIYRIVVNQYARRETEDVGFTIETEYGRIINQYSYGKAVKPSETIECFLMTVSNGKLVSTKVGSGLVGGMASQDKWGVKTETLVPVIAVMNSPNHWGSNEVGSKHTIFALDGCKNPDTTRGIYNEFLRGDLEKHRKVFEVLGAKTKCPPSDEQISGVGFTAARGDSVIIVVDDRRGYVLNF